ncbi:dipeptidase PepV [Aerococcus urinaehominis]|uniref:Dipeptidase PepV n=1 Tax=Aerococcus urinaehominis TaxID=128944 RepID=A0A109RGJ8_9LACT|nr:dipeptidase PepV [Aerococcus urinaehominis]AMB98904.1 dipeptidase PepV [Aerococcus urinaehominis]SDM61035.1 succinyl-diaminopimelate desuccinylase [Aerococcus urinaehominis]
MAIDWKAEVESRKDDLLADLSDLLSIESIRNDDLATADAPVGPGPKAALTAFLDLAKQDGFTTKSVANLAGHADYGEGDEILGVIAHVDVVPVDNLWDTDPFKPVVKDNRLYARGASDDKGPLMAAYYGLKIIKDLQLPLSKKVRFIIGTDEESNWQCMDAYFAEESKPDFGFSPDANFPIINGEKGLYSSRLDFPALAGDLLSFEAGQRENMVPAQATARLAKLNLETSQDQVDHYAQTNQVEVILNQLDNGQVDIKLKGQASHGAQPENGLNAGAYLADLLTQLDFAGNDQAFLSFTSQLLKDDHFGEKLAIAHEDDIMGRLTMNPGVFKGDQTGGHILLNIRVPKGLDFSDIDKQLVKWGETYGFTSQVGSKTNKPPHYVPADDPLVETLLDVYHRQTGLPAHEMSIGGGTYGRLLDRGVAYGAMFPDSVDTMHQANEFIDLDDLWAATAIYAEAIYELAK